MGQPVSCWSPNRCTSQVTNWEIIVGCMPSGEEQTLSVRKKHPSFAHHPNSTHTTTRAIQNNPIQCNQTSPHRTKPILESSRVFTNFHVRRCTGANVNGHVGTPFTHIRMHVPLRVCNWKTTVEFFSEAFSLPLPVYVVSRLRRPGCGRLRERLVSVGRCSVGAR